VLVAIATLLAAELLRLAAVEIVRGARDLVWDFLCANNDRRADEEVQAAAVVFPGAADDTVDNITNKKCCGNKGIFDYAEAWRI